MKKHFGLFLGFLMLFIYFLLNPIFNQRGPDLFVNLLYGILTGYHLASFMNYKK